MALRYPSHKISSMERYVAESTTAISGGTLALTDRVIVRLALSGNSAFTLENGSEDGQYRILIAESVTGSTRLESNSTVVLCNRAWLPQVAGEAIGLIWNAAYNSNAGGWFEVWRSLNYDSTTGIYVKNTTGATVTTGTVVFISGALGNNPFIAVSDYSTEPLSAKTIGLVHQDIAANDFGYVVTNGIVDKIASVPGAAGNTLYLGASGAITATKPVAPNHIVKVGNVLKPGANGSVQVWVSNGWELNELHDVLITTPTTGQVLTYDATTSLWKNAAGGGGGGSPSIGGTITGGTAGSILFVNPAATIAEDNTNLYWDDTNNKLGITPQTAATPSAKLEVNYRGTASLTEYCAEFKNSSTTNDAGRVLFSQGSTVGLALQTQGTGGAAYKAPFQWITRSTGATINTPLTLNADASITLGANLTIPEIAAPATPSAGTNTLYAKTDKNLYYKNNSGTEYQLTPAGSGLSEVEVMARAAWCIW